MDAATRDTDRAAHLLALRKMKLPGGNPLPPTGKHSTSNSPGPSPGVAT